MSTETATIGKKLRWIKGKKPTNLFEIPNENAIPYLSASYFRTNKPDYYTDVKDKNCVPVSADEVVLIWDGSNAGDVFCGLKGALSSTMVKFKKSEECDTQFLYFLLKNNFKNLNKQTTGSTIPHVSGSVLKDIKIPFPSLPEQKEIARVLTVVQEAIAGQEELITKLKELKRGMMQYLFTHGTKGEKTKMTKIGEMPESWEIVEFQGMVEFSKKPKGVSLNTDIPFVPMDIVPVDGMFIKNYEIRKKVTSGTFVINGDILLSKITPSFENGKQGILEIDSKYGYATTEVIPFHEKINISEKLFIYYWLKKDDVRNDLASKMEGSTGRRRLSKSVLDKKLIPKPNIAEQKEIANILISIDKKIEASQEKLSTYQSLFKTLLHELMSGERRVNI